MDKTNSSDDSFLTVRQVAARYDLPESRVRRLCRHGQIRGVFKNEGGDWMIPNEGIRDWFNKQPRPSLWERIVLRLERLSSRPTLRLLAILIGIIGSFAMIIGLTVDIPTLLKIIAAPTPKIAMVTSPLPATSTPVPTSTSTPMPTGTPLPFLMPTVMPVMSNADLPGYSKQSSIVRDSQGTLTLFVVLPEKRLAFVQSSDDGHVWSTSVVFDQINLKQGGPQLVAAVDSADKIHAIWGRAPESGDINYGVLANGQWIISDTVAAGVFARDIAVDSANHPHIVWTTVDLFYKTFNGQEWSRTDTIAHGAWHPDIQIDSSDNVHLFANSATFYATPGVSVYAINNVGGSWNDPVKVSTSPFWSGGAAAAITKDGSIYLTWIASSDRQGGRDEVFFSRYIDGQWQSPFHVGDLNASAGSTGQESPAVAFDKNDVFYVFWRGLDEKNRAAIFGRALVPETSPLASLTTGWSQTMIMRGENVSEVNWPSIADVRSQNRIVGVDIVWVSVVGRDSVIQYAHVTYP